MLAALVRMHVHIELQHLPAIQDLVGRQPLVTVNTLCSLHEQQQTAATPRSIAHFGLPDLLCSFGITVVTRLAVLSSRSEYLAGMLIQCWATVACT